MRIPVANLRPLLAAAEPQWRANLDALFAAGQFILGPQVAAFEREFAEATGAGFTVGVGNGTDAIALALRDAGVRGEVLTSALTAPFTATAIRAAGCQPRFVDVDPGDLQMEVHDLAARASGRTRGIVAVHLYGQPCHIASTAAVCRMHDAVLIQDACQAHGARSGVRPLTELSRYVCYSFYPTKNLGALGDGGAVATDDEATARRLASLRDGGRGNRPQVAELEGVNSRLDEMQCCFLRAFLPSLAASNERRRRIADRYDELLRGCPGVDLVLRSHESVCHLYVIRVQQRLQLRKYLERFGIGTAVHYPAPLHLHPAFADCGLKRGDLPVAERVCEEILTLPLWPHMEEWMISEVAERIWQFYGGDAR
ncbi:MAG: DegT/DnrJ/EryC1/StrS family aminotransferase [Acidobacteria bacterium]|nr:DegT/DnrJ/EryC1/StrS family aminotransferase [Acidobacteriota bacterium]